MAELTDPQTQALYDAWLHNDTNRGLEWLLPIVTDIVREHVTAALDRHGEAVPADVTTYDREIVHAELRDLVLGYRQGQDR